MTGRARRVPKEPSLSHATVLKKDTLDSNRSVAELNVPDRMRSNMPLISVKVNDEVCTVGEVFRLRGPSPSSKIDQRQAPSLMRSKSTHSGVPGLPRAADAEVARDTAPSQSVASSQSLRKPSGLRKPSPKLGFFDTVSSFYRACGYTHNIVAASCTIPIPKLIFLLIYRANNLISGIKLMLC